MKENVVFAGSCQCSLTVGLDCGEVHFQEPGDLEIGQTSAVVEGNDRLHDRVEAFEHTFEAVLTDTSLESIPRLYSHQLLDDFVDFGLLEFSAGALAEVFLRLVFDLITRPLRETWTLGAVPLPDLTVGQRNAHGNLVLDPTVEAIFDSAPESPLVVATPQHTFG